MIKHQENFLHDTSKWFVKKENGKVVPFNGKQLNAKLDEIAKLTFINNPQLINQFNLNTVGLIVTIQICAEIKIRLKEFNSNTEIPIRTLQEIIERKLSEVSFPLAKTFIIHNVLKLIKRNYNIHDDVQVNKEDILQY